MAALSCIEKCTIGGGGELIWISVLAVALRFAEFCKTHDIR
jgi:hypothetical protein